MALNKVTNAKPVAANNDSDIQKLAKLIEKQSKIHHQMCDIFEKHDLDIDDVRDGFTEYGKTVVNLYEEVT